MVEPAGTTVPAGTPPASAAPAPVSAGTPAPAAAAPSPAAPAAIPIVGDIPIIEPTPEPPPASPTPPPATPGSPAGGDLAPRPGETAEAYAVRLKAGGIEIQRTADAQRAMHAATAKAADLDRKLKNILGPPVAGPEARVAPPGTPAPVPHAAPVAAPAPSPAPPPALSAGIQPQGIEAAIQALYAEYSNVNLSEPQAFEKLVKGAVELGAAEAMRRMTSDQGLADRIYGYVTGRAQNAAKVEAAAKEIEGFWTESAPHVPAELLWSYSEHAARAHPNDVPKQALFCLEHALGAMEKVSAHLAQATQTTDAMRRGQEAMLPGGGGAPPAAVTPGKFPSLVDQMRAARASQPGA